MKRLIRKSTLSANEVKIGDEVTLQDDQKYKNLDMNAMSLPQNRDGVVLVDVKNKKLYIGLNGETHAQLLEKYYNIDQHSDDLHLDVDSYVAYGIYLKDFLGQESVLMYNVLPGVKEVIKQELPGAAVYEEEYFNDALIRIAKE